MKLTDSLALAVVWVESEEYLGVYQEVPTSLEGNRLNYVCKIELIKSKKTMDSLSHIKPIA